MGTYNYKANLDPMNLSGAKSGKKTQADAINETVKNVLSEPETIRNSERRPMNLSGAGRGLVSPPTTLIGDEEEEEEEGFSSTAEMLKTFFGWNDKYTTEATPLNTERDPEQVTNLLPPPEMAAREAEMASRFPTAEQSSDKYALVMRKHGGPKRNKMDSLLKDQVFLDVIDRLKKDHPDLPLDKFYQIIEGESAGNTDDRNPNSGAVGLWQVTSKALIDLKERDLVPQDLSLAKIRDMGAGEQLDLYSKYLTRWGYDGKMSLGMLQAAPSKRKIKNKDTVIFKKGSDAWEQNPNWRGPNNIITGKTIDEYYFGNPVERSLRPVLRSKELEEEKKEG